jgi:hypothetical protein
VRGDRISQVLRRLGWNGADAEYIAHSDLRRTLTLGCGTGRGARSTRRG